MLPSRSSAPLLHEIIEKNNEEEDMVEVQETQGSHVSTLMHPNQAQEEKTTTSPPKKKGRKRKSPTLPAAAGVFRHMVEEHKKRDQNAHGCYFYNDFSFYSLLEVLENQVGKLNKLLSSSRPRYGYCWDMLRGILAFAGIYEEWNGIDDGTRFHAFVRVLQAAFHQVLHHLYKTSKLKTVSYLHTTIHAAHSFFGSMGSIGDPNNSFDHFEENFYSKIKNIPEKKDEELVQEAKDDDAYYRNSVIQYGHQYGSSDDNTEDSLYLLPNEPKLSSITSSSSATALHDKFNFYCKEYCCQEAKDSKLKRFVITKDMAREHSLDKFDPDSYSRDEDLFDFFF